MIIKDLKLHPQQSNLARAYQPTPLPKRNTDVRPALQPCQCFYHQRRVTSTVSYDHQQHMTPPSTNEFQPVIPLYALPPSYGHQRRVTPPLTNDHQSPLTQQPTYDHQRYVTQPSTNDHQRTLTPPPSYDQIRPVTPPPSYHHLNL